jgi:hypothetical protein
MRNAKVAELERACRHQEFDYRAREGESHYKMVLDIDEFAQQIVGETIVAILATDTRHGTWDYFNGSRSS